MILIVFIIIIFLVPSILIPACNDIAKEKEVKISKLKASAFQYVSSIIGNKEAVQFKHDCTFCLIRLLEVTLNPLSNRVEIELSFLVKGNLCLTKRINLGVYCDNYEYSKRSVGEIKRDIYNAVEEAVKNSQIDESFAKALEKD